MHSEKKHGLVWAMGLQTLRLGEDLRASDSIKIIVFQLILPENAL